MNAKQKAIEILKSQKSLSKSLNHVYETYLQGNTSLSDIVKEYWREVKTEIEKP